MKIHFGHFFRAYPKHVETDGEKRLSKFYRFHVELDLEDWSRIWLFQKYG